MEDTKEQRKIKEARYLILIPLVITVVCLWLDLWTSYASGAFADKHAGINEGEIVGTFILQNETGDSISVYKSHNNSSNWIDHVATVIRCGMGYLFPSLLSIVVAMIWQQQGSSEELYGVRKGKVGYSVLATVAYSVVFITCLIKYNIGTALAAVLASAMYVWYVYTFCIDERIKPKKKSQMSSDELLLHYINKKQGGA